MQFKADFHFNEGNVDSKFLVAANSKGRNTFSLNTKKFGIPLLGSYSLGEREYHCREGDCLILYDLGRGVSNYYTNWVWVATNAYLPDKRAFAFNIVDGGDNELGGE